MHPTTWYEQLAGLGKEAMFKGEIIIAVSIPVIGWLVNHVLTIKAQNKNFRNQIVNDARLKITEAIRDYQGWLGQVDVTIRTLSCKLIIPRHGAYWAQEVEALTELFYSDKRRLEWLFCLEEHEILFPKTAECRKDLANRHNQIQEYLSSFLNELSYRPLEDAAASEYLKGVIEKAKIDVGILITQIGLMEDLRVYLQNLCLSSFTGYKIPERIPGDLSCPRLIQDRKGTLQIVSTKNTIGSGG